MRDIVLNRIPVILLTETYAVAATAGAAVCVVCLRGDLRRSWPLLVGAAVCFVLRMVSWALDWNLPQVLR